MGGEVPEERQPPPPVDNNEEQTNNPYDNLIGGLVGTLVVCQDRYVGRSQVVRASIAAVRGVVVVVVEKSGRENEERDEEGGRGGEVSWCHRKVMSRVANGAGGGRQGP